MTTIIIFDLDDTLVSCKMKIPRQTYHMLNKFKNSIKLGKNCCLNIDNGDISDAKTSGLIENIRLKTQIIISAVEAVEMIIRIDKMFLKEYPYEYHMCNYCYIYSLRYLIIYQKIVIHFHIFQMFQKSKLRMKLD